MGEITVAQARSVDHGTSHTGSVERLDSGVSSRTQAVTTTARRQRRATGRHAHQRTPHASSRLTPSQRTAATRPMTSKSLPDGDIATPRSDTESPGRHILIASRAVR